jgi:hypothetical protein
MAIEWTLGQCLEAKNIHNAYQLHDALESELGIIISPQALRKLLVQSPRHLRIETAQVLCNLLQEPLETYLRVLPEPIVRAATLIHPYHPKPEQVESLFDNPLKYL